MRCELVTGVQTCALPILVGEIEPDAVGAGEQQRGNQEDRPARHLAFRCRPREMQLGLAVEAADLCLEALDDLVAVETEVIGVAAHETPRVGGARRILEDSEERRGGTVGVRRGRSRGCAVLYNKKQTTQ